MPEIINPEQHEPLTVRRLITAFKECGLDAGQTVLVHSAMSKLGWVAGGAVAVIQALQAVITPQGTLIMPTHTAANTNPANWHNPPVPENWWQVIRDESPAFDSALTPTFMMGTIPELFRTFPDVKRGQHPIASFAAWGRYADYLIFEQTLDDFFGDNSPLSRLYAIDGYVLLLGVNHGNNTSLHLAETRAKFPNKKRIQEGTAMLINGKRQWVEFEMPQYDDEDFAQLGEAYEQAHDIPVQRVGFAEAHFMKQRPLVDWAVNWFEEHRR